MTNAIQNQIVERGSIGNRRKKRNEEVLMVEK